jgi:acyl-CoA thioesterase
MRVETGRAPLWATVQFVAQAGVGASIDCDTEIVAEGRGASQVRIAASVDGRLIFTALGAAGLARSASPDASFGQMPDVGPPEKAVPWRPPFPVPEGSSRFGPWRTAELLEPTAPGPKTRLWARMRAERQTAETISYLADYVPGLALRAAGRSGVGVSLDNSIRFGPPPDCEWILVDVDPYFVYDGYVHGAARIWSRDGVLLAVASQTAATRLLD